MASNDTNRHGDVTVAMGTDFMFHDLVWTAPATGAVRFTARSADAALAIADELLAAGAVERKD